MDHAVWVKPWKTTCLKKDSTCSGTVTSHLMNVALFSAAMDAPACSFLPQKTTLRKIRLIPIKNHTHFIAIAGKSLNTSRPKTRCASCYGCYLFHHSEILNSIKLWYEFDFWVTNFPCVFSEREVLAEILSKYFET